MPRNNYGIDRELQQDERGEHTMYKEFRKPVKELVG